MSKKKEAEEIAMYRTKTCGELKKENIGQTVELAGWVQKIRNLGGMVFIDLRDEFGITQITIQDEKLQEEVKEINTESCIHIIRKGCGKKQQKYKNCNRRNRSRC